MLNVQTASVAEGPGGMQHIAVAARLAQLAGNLGQAEEVYVQNGRALEAVQMYRRMLKWNDAIR